MRSTPPAAIEVLEARIAPAGVITASLIAGKLTLTGDAADNAFTLTSSGAGSYDFIGTAGTTIVLNGDPAVPNVTISLAITDVVLNLGAGNDNVALNGLLLGKGLTVNAGAGDDILLLGNSRIDGAFTYLGGTGTDSLELGGGSVHAGRISADLGADPGTFTATLNSLTVKGDFIVKGGAAADTVNLSSARFQVGGNLSLLLGASASNVTISSANLAVERSLTLSQSLVTTPSALTFTTPTFSVGRDFLVTSTGPGDTVLNIESTADFGVGGRTVLTGGAGVNTQIFQTVRASFLGGLTTALGNGENVVSIFAAEAAQIGPIKMVGGVDQDSLDITASDHLILTSAVDAQLGVGTNVFNLTGADSVTLGGAVKVTTGAGADTVFLTGALLLARRGLALSLGAGDNSFDIDGDVAHISGPVTYVGGAATAGTQTVQVAVDDAFFGAGFSIQTPGGVLAASFTHLGSLTMAGELRVSALGAGDKDLVVSSTRATIGGGVNYTGGSTANTFTLNATSYHLGKVKIVGGAGVDTVNLTGSGQVAGLVDVLHGAGENSLTVNGGAQRTALQLGLKYLSTSTAAQLDAVSLTGVALPAAVSVKLGAGGSEVTLDDILATGALTIDTGAGSDTVNLERVAGAIASAYRGPVKILLGAGDDTANLGFAGDPLGVVDLRSVLTIDGGAGLDTVTQANVVPGLGGSVTLLNVP